MVTICVHWAFYIVLDQPIVSTAPQPVRRASARNQPSADAKGNAFSRGCFL